MKCIWLRYPLHVPLSQFASLFLPPSPPLSLEPYFGSASLLLSLQDVLRARGIVKIIHKSENGGAGRYKACWGNQDFFMRVCIHTQTHTHTHSPTLDWAERITIPWRVCVCACVCMRVSCVHAVCVCTGGYRLDWAERITVPMGYR